MWQKITSTLGWHSPSSPRHISQPILEDHFPPTPTPKKKKYKKHVNKNMFHPVKHISCLQESSDSVRVLTHTRCMCQHIDICFSTFSHCFSTLICVDLNDCFKVLSLIPSSQPELGLPYVAVQVDSWVTASLAFVPWQKHWLPHTEEGGFSNC